jgi:hypothetical protein
MYFQSSQHSAIYEFFALDIIAMPFSTCLHTVLQFELLLIKAIKIVMLRAAKLRSYWKQVFFTINLLPQFYHSAPQRAARKSLMEKPT